MIPRARVEALEIPREFVRPVLPSPRRLTQGTVGRGPDGFPELEEPLALIDCREHEETLASRHPKFHGYLLEGKAKGVHEGYLARSRTPWYSQEHRPPPPLLCTYMGRSVAGRPPFRIIVNESDAVATNVYLLLYPKPWLQRVPDHARRLAELVRRVSLGAFANEGRVYGGGLQKMEPKELARLPLDVPDDWKALMGGQPTLDL